MDLVWCCHQQEAVCHLDVVRQLRLRSPYCPPDAPAGLPPLSSSMDHWTIHHGEWEK